MLARIPLKARKPCVLPLKGAARLLAEHNGIEVDSITTGRKINHVAHATGTSDRRIRSSRDRGGGSEQGAEGLANKRGSVSRRRIVPCARSISQYSTCAFLTILIALFGRVYSKSD
jgi:hypothetical protein